MRRKLVLAGLLFTVSSTAQDDFMHRVANFDKPYQLMVQTLCGWATAPPPDPDHPLCDPNKSLVFPRKRYEEAREAAKKLFDLTEPK